MRGFGSALTACALTAAISAADAAELTPGVELPAIEAQTLSGDPAMLPRDARGHAMVLVVGFTKAASKVTRPWLEGCRTQAAAKVSDGPTVSCYDVRMLEEVPKFLRGMTERGMKSGFPPELQRSTLLVYTDNDAWRDRLGVTDKKTAYVIGCDAQGVVRGAASGEYAESDLKRILDAIQTKPPG